MPHDEDSPPEFRSREPTPEMERRWDRAMQLKDAWERLYPEQTICYLDVYSDQFSDENWTGVEDALKESNK